MAAPLDSLLIAIAEDAVSELADMGRETGYRLDYAGVVRVPLAFPEMAGGVPDLPFVQVWIGETLEGGAPGAGIGDEVSNDQLRHVHELHVRVFVPPERREDGDLDLIRPMMNAEADVFQALMGQSLGARHRGSEWATTYFLRGLSQAVATQDLSSAGIVHVIYGIEWDHSASGMDTEPGG